MPTAHDTEARAWLRQADSDLHVAELVAEDHPDVACYLAQQAAEKEVKSAYLRYGRRAKPTHNLVSLIMRAPRRFPDHWQRGLHADVAVLSLYEAEARYPNLRGKDYKAPAEDFTRDQAHGAIQTAKRIRGACRKFLSGG